MKKIYACLAGQPEMWNCLTDDPECVMGVNKMSPLVWYEENAEIWSPKNPKENTYYELDHVLVFYKGVDYRVSPAFIQVVTE